MMSLNLSRRVLVKPHEYYDSVRLMQVSERARALEGVREAILVMATDNNKRLLQGGGLLSEEAQAAGRDDLILGIVAVDDATADRALLEADGMLREKVGTSAQSTYRTLDSAMSAMPDASLALISVPGEYAAAEARRALERDLNVFLFSDNVPLDDEITLKTTAREKGLLVMGPDCGTAIVNHVCLGFANVVRPGSIGIVGASGTGIQQISVLLDRDGVGISQALGTGGRDLSAAVGGITMLQGIDLLEADEKTGVILLTSKPPDAAVASAVLSKAAKCTKPVVVNFLGGDCDEVRKAGATPARTLEEAAWLAARLARGESIEQVNPTSTAEIERIAAEESGKMATQQKYLRGLFCGGTLSYEAMLILKDSLGPVFSNIASRPELRLQDPWTSYEHTVVDLGEDEFTRGRAHPMIDPTLRCQRLLAEAEDSSVAVLLLDIVLGYGSHPDPAGSLVVPIREAKARARKAGRYLSVVASVCGTEADPQGLAGQEKVLAEVGVLVMPSNAQATRLAGAIARRCAER